MTRSPLLIVEESIELDLDQLTRSLDCDVDLIVTLVHEGALEVQGDSPALWRFHGATLQRARRAVRLVRDLDINPPGVALALDLLDEVRQLEAELIRRT
jgi:chaperone modulatory protein CbpM